MVGWRRSSLVLVSAIWMLIAVDVAELSCENIRNGQALTLECICDRKEDVRLAARCSSAAYDDSLKVNDTIPGTEWRIDAIINKYTLYKYLTVLESFIWRKPTLNVKEELKAIIAHPEDPNDNAIILCFRGTAYGLQLIEQVASSFQTLQTVDKKVSLGYEYRQPFKVMKYFWDVLKTVDQQLFPIFTSIWNNEDKRSMTRYIVAGHSLGGALAQLFTLRLRAELNADLMENEHSRLITFGSPRVGDTDFASEHDREIFRGQKMRFIHESDIVAHIPPKPGVANHGLMKQFEKVNKNLAGDVFQELMKMYEKFVGDPPNYKHADTQVWIHKERLKVCNGKDNDGEKCSNADSVTARGLRLKGIKPIGFLDHDMDNYNNKIDQLLEKECKPF